MKSIKKIIIFGTITLIAILLIRVCCNNTSRNTENTNIDTLKSVINVPLPNLNINYASYSVNPKRDTILTYKTGSKLIIPQNAFLDSKCNIVKSKVDIKYREFSNAFDIYLGGIPMVYTENGEEFVFETAGMLEINATTEGNPVFPNPDKKIKLKMNSFQSGDKYNLYSLDTITGKWANIGKDIVETKKYKDELAKLPEVPPTPKKAGQSSFSIGDDTEEYPELAMYENVLFEPIEGNYSGFSCTEIKVKKMNQGKYEVTFIQDAYGIHKEGKYICYLAFKEGVDYDNAMNIYQNKYSFSIAKREKIRKEIELEWEIYRNAVKEYNIDVFNLNFQQLDPNQKVIRTLDINGFGFINIDYPSDYPQGAELMAQFKDNNDNNINLTNIVLIEKERNALFRYKDIIKFNPAKENILWGITDNGELAYFNSDDFKSVTSTSGIYIFSMKIHNGELKTYEDIVSVLFN